MGISKPARHWIGTIPRELFSPGPMVEQVVYCKGQLEVGAGGFEHWQVYVILESPGRLSALVKLFGRGSHWEPTRSEAARGYVWKEDTCVDGTKFEYGAIPFKRSSKEDWSLVVTEAKRGNFEGIPPDILVRYYSNLSRMRADYSVPVGAERDVYVFWGRSGSGKSMRAWSEAGELCYCKDPLTKWWCGYQGQTSVVIDEFRGTISISHLLRWFDRYPVRVETKGGSIGLAATKIWITSNLAPSDWYPDLDSETLVALLRRIKVTHFV